jgi:predicted ATPase/class 3 adenylate cyclase
VLPEGTVTFLFTDLEGSTRLLEAHPAAYREAVARHHALLRGAVEAHGGVVFETVGDAVYAAFARPTDAVAAALEGQVALHREPWGATGPLRARMGVHLGEAERQGAHYFGAPLYRCARLTAAAHGGQVVLSEAATAPVRDALPAGAALRDLGAHRLKDLHQPERVFQLAAPDLPSDFPPLRTLDLRPHNLPLQVTSFVGRDTEAAAVRGLLATYRLVTLTGPGGTGKTRLALQAAADVLPAYPDGVWLVELAALADPALVPQTVAQAVGVREAPGRPLVATLVDALQLKRLLLVLDNCEHLLDAGARLADALLRTCARVTLLVTSREALGIAGETAYRVPSLGVPDLGPSDPPGWSAPPGAARSLPAAGLTRYGAVRLFLDRAVAAAPGFAVTDRNAPAVARLCARLDGIPLAIELAAARVRVLPVEQLLGRLEDRFRLLTGGSRTALERHQTLRAAVDWSYDLLGERERGLFDRLSVFAGGWSLEAAEAVGADPDGDGIAPAEVLELLARLVDKSLVVAEAQPDGSARYRLLETLRQYALEKLAARGDAEAVRQRHAACYVGLGETAAARRRGAWLVVLEAEHDNLRAALDWTLAAAGTGDGAADAGAAGARDEAALVAYRLGAALTWFWTLRGHWHEMAAVWDRLAALPRSARPAVVAARARALGSAGLVEYVGGRHRDLGRRLLEEALALFTQVGDRCEAVRVRAWLATDPAPRRRLYERLLALDRAAGDDRATADTLYAFATLLITGAGAAPDYAVARGMYAECLRLRRALGDEVWAGMAQSRLGFVAREQGDAAGALPLLEASLATFRGLGDRFHAAWALRNLGNAAADLGDHALARTRYAEALAVEAELGYGSGVAAALERLAGLDAVGGRPARALRLAGAAAALRTTAGGWRSPRDQAQLEQRVAAAREALGETAAAAASAEGQAMDIKAAVAYALSEPADA